MKLSYKRDMTHNYMVPDIAGGVCEEDYRIRMLLENHILGLLPCSLKKVNCQTMFFFDITSKQSMEHIYEKGKMSAEDIRIFLRGLHLALKELKKYLLDTDRLVLEPQMIYMDIESREPAFCYLPSYQQEITQSFREIAGYILEHLDPEDEQAVLLGYELYRRAGEENYSLEQLLKRLGSPIQVQRAQSGAEPERTPYMQDRAEAERAYHMQDRAEAGRAHYMQDRAEAERAYHMQDEAEPGHAYHMQDKAEAGRAYHMQDEAEPGRAYHMQDKAKTGRAYHMQDKAKTGHAHYMRNKAEMEQVPYMKEKTETGQRKTEKKREGKKQKKIQKTKERKERTAKKEAAGPGMFLIAGGIFAIVLAGAAAWMWGMDTTQIGGVVFVLAGILIYGCRLDGREKKKKKNDDSGMESWEREADLSYEGWKEADGFCEWEKEGGKEGCPGAGKSDGGWNTASVPPEFSVREQRDRQYNLHGGHLAGETGSRRQQLGDTGVLYEDGPSYAPTPVLVSADPRRSESMVLTDNSYTVGKLAAQSDIVLDHPSVSRVHAKIEKWDGEYYVHDLNSTNGTFINGRRLDIHESVPIYPGDEIFFAKVGFHVGRC